MRRYRINYDEKRDCFAQIRHVPSQLIWGNLNFVPIPFLTYTIPAYKRAYLLKEALESVLHQLPVDFTWDVIVVDNEAGGENETERLIREMADPRILYYRNKENLGVDGNYNRCIELARGRWIAMLHADDLLINDHLRLMRKYIRAHEHDRKPLAYISPQYVEFRGKEKILLKRPKKGCVRKDYLSQILCQENYGGRLKRLRQIDGAVRGDTASLPSFGTVMNRKIMLREGGFNDRLGTCEDIITPYKLACKYKVYKTPKVMGYYRFEGNESMKTETILHIYESMVDFREYMYSRNYLMGIWGEIARNEMNRSLAEYCIQMSRFSERKLTKKDFESIYTPKIQPQFTLRLFQILIGVSRKLSGTDTVEEKCNILLNNVEDKIRQRMWERNEFIIYGAGKAGTYTVRYLRKHFPNIHILCIAVSSETDNQRTLEKIPVKSIYEVKAWRKTATVITAVTIQQYQDEMNEVLSQNSFEHVINLLTEIRDNFM